MKELESVSIAALLNRSIRTAHVSAGFQTVTKYRIIRPATPGSSSPSATRWAQTAHRFLRQRTGRAPGNVSLDELLIRERMCSLSWLFLALGTERGAPVTNCLPTTAVECAPDMGYFRESRSSRYTGAAPERSHFGQK